MRGGFSPINARQSKHNEAKYKRQFIRTAANKARRIAKEKKRQSK